MPQSREAVAAVVRWLRGRAPAAAAITSSAAAAPPFPARSQQLLSFAFSSSFIRLFHFQPDPHRRRWAVGETKPFIYSRCEVGQSQLYNFVIMFGTQVSSICYIPCSRALVAATTATSARSRSVVGSVSEEGLWFSAVRNRLHRVLPGPGSKPVGRSVGRSVDDSNDGRCGNVAPRPPFLQSIRNHLKQTDGMGS